VETSTWLIEPRYTTVQFIGKIAWFFKVRGCFREIEGQIIRGESDLGRSSVEAAIRTSSLDTGNQRRDNHLRSKDFLEVNTFPEIHYVSTSVAKGRDRDTLRVSGTLTIKEVSRELVLEVTEVERSRSPQGNEVAYYSVQTELDRNQFGVRYLRGLIGSRLKVTIHVQAARQA
jgi:polyisoprenoid-binding protein YceI